MRVLICKIHWPFVCFCKPSDAAAAHLYSSGPLKLENTQPQPQPIPSASTVASLSDTSNQLSAVIEPTQVKDQNSHSDGKVHVENPTTSTSCIKNSPAAVKCSKNKKVRWIDNVGRELAEIKEFDSFETRDSDDEDDNKGCMCIIL